MNGSTMHMKKSKIFCRLLLPRSPLDVRGDAMRSKFCIVHSDAETRPSVPATWNETPIIRVPLEC